MKEMLRILQIEDSEDDAALILREIRSHGYDIHALRVDTASALRETLAGEPWDIILCDYSLPQFNALAALEIVRGSGLDLPFVVVSGAIGEETAVRLMREGANDYVWKDKLVRLIHVIRRELDDANVRRMRREAETALKAALEAAEAERSRIDTIIRSVPDGLLVCDDKERVVLVNRVAEQLLELRHENTINRPLVDLFEESGVGRQLRTLTEPTADEGRVVDLQLPLPGSKYPRVIQTRTSTMKNRAGGSLGTVMLLRDITRERELDRMKTEIISTAAHELSTPLAAIVGYTELLLNPEDFGEFRQDQQREFLGEIYRKSTALAAIVEELLDISRIESGQGMNLKKAPCDLRRLIEKEVRHFHIHARGHTFQIDLPAEMPQEFLVDENKMEVVLGNLLSNAVKYSPEGGCIRVAGRLEEDCFVCSVKDEGIGMTEEQTRRVFDRFYRVDATNTAVTGLGLGLSLAKEIVEHHGGRIWLESEPGCWTRASFSLPV